MKIITGFPWIYVYIFHGKLYGTDTSKLGSQIHGYSSSGFRDSMIWLGVTQTEPSPAHRFRIPKGIPYRFLIPKDTHYRLEKIAHL